MCSLITMSDRRFFGRYVIGIVFSFCLIGGPTALAQSCVIENSPYNLTVDTVTWSMTTIPGATCFGGVRFGNVIIESVKLISPPRTGQIVLRGSGFSYTAKANFRGEDSFALKVSGAINRRRGNSTVQILVSIADRPHEPTPPAAVERSLTTVPVLRVPAPPPTNNDDHSYPIGAAQSPCPEWDWSKGESPPPMRQPFDRSKLYCPPSPFRPPSSPIGCICQSR
jgi:hypothetical protein